MMFGFGASTRRTSRLSATTLPGVRSGIRVEQLTHLVKAGNGLEVLDRGREHVEFAVALAGERLEWMHPEVGDRLAVVVQRYLAGRRRGDEEARVVPARR